MEELDELEQFRAFQKIARLSRNCSASEKLDGSNGQIAVYPDGRVRAGSRNRWLTPEADNFGFARWVQEHQDELREGLGAGRHFGEWWGSGIQRGYGLTKGEKRFSLFNTGRWNADNVPACCSVVPVLYEGLFDTNDIQAVVEELAREGSKAAPGFMDPEGVVVYHAASGGLFKKTIKGDEAPKGAAAGGTE